MSFHGISQEPVQQRTGAPQQSSLEVGQNGFQGRHPDSDDDFDDHDLWHDGHGESDAEKGDGTGNIQRKKVRRAKPRRRARRGKRSEAISELKCIFANTTHLGPTVLEYFAKTPHHIWGIAETHLREKDLDDAIKLMERNKWVTSASPARLSNKSEKGTQGGTMMGHKPWLQSAIPVEAIGQGGKIMPAEDMVFKYFRLRGCNVCFVFAYFENGIGLTGENLHKCDRINAIRDNGRVHVIVAADFNVHPDEWEKSDILQKLDVQIRVPENATATCRIAGGGGSLIDYLLVSTAISPIVTSVSTVTNVPWKPHSAIEFIIKSAPELIQSRQLRAPKKLPFVRDEKGKLQQWSIDEAEWKAYHVEAEEEAQWHMQAVRHSQEEQAKLVRRIGVEEEALELGKEYAQWSIAAERACTAALTGMPTGKGGLGRGVMPKVEFKDHFDKSSNKQSEHMQWGLKPEYAVTGGDLYTTFWATIRGMTMRWQDEARKAGEETDSQTAWKGVRRDYSFLLFITTSATSPLRASLSKGGDEDDEEGWEHFLTWPFFRSTEVYDGMIAKATSKMKKMAALAKIDASHNFHEWLSEDIDAGGKGMHRYVKNEIRIDPTVKDENGKRINDPMQIIEHHTKVWQRHWKCEDKEAADAALAAVQELRQEAVASAAGENERRGAFTAEEIRSAAKRFKPCTSIGADGWSFRHIQCMPAPVLEDLGAVLWKAKTKMICPIQVYLNLLASLPKKTGDTRTVAIMASFYRLLMELDDQRLVEFEEKNAYKNDSARRGASSVAAAEERALEAEVKALLGQKTCTLLWDFTNLFDSIDVPILIREAKAVGFPLAELALTLTAHIAPRMLKMGKAVGRCVEGFGRSIIAGDKRSTQLARAYTLRLVRYMATKFLEVTLYQHVDDMTNLVKPESEGQLAITAIRYAMAFKEQTDKLKLTISNKTMVVPDNEHTQKIARVLNRAGIPMKTAAKGVDIGVDTSSGTVRTTAKQAERVREGKRRANRAETLAKVDHRAKLLGLTNINPAQAHGYTAVGAAPSTIESYKRNIVKATGIGRNGCCATTTLAWSFRRQHHKLCRSADPRIVMPLGQVRTWMRLWHNANGELRRDIKQCWKTALRKMADKGTRWMRVTGPLTATIATLFDVGWTPALPNQWLTKDKRQTATFDDDEGVSQYHICHCIENDIL
jgi:hypothetical protein